MAKTAGVIGGMGPDATVDFMSKVIAATPARIDQDHIPMLVDHNPRIPSRRAAVFEGGEDPGPAIAAAGRRLQAAGADFLVMPCNFAHAFAGPLLEAVTVPFLSIIDVTAGACSRYRTVALLATDGCLQTGIYHDATARRGIDLVVPDDGELRDFMQLIDRIKAGDRAGDISTAIKALAEKLVRKGADAVVAGCTEIPLVLDESMLSVPLISSTDLLARATVDMALS